MIRIDTHTHTAFSPDSKFDPIARLEQARDLGVGFLAVTDHMDIGCAPLGEHTINYNYYFEVFEGWRRQNPTLDLAIGIECGFTRDNITDNAEVLARFPFEYILNSVHGVGGKDCYFASYFKGKSRKEAYNQYFEAVLASLDVPYYFDAVAHLGYVVRSAPYADRDICFKESGEVIDAILKKLIAKNKILEVNANIRRYSPHTPDSRILRRYKQLGGELITYGSDAHSAEQFLQNYELVAGLVRECGFDYFFTAKNKVLSPIKIVT